MLLWDLSYNSMSLMSGNLFLISQENLNLPRQGTVYLQQRTSNMSCHKTLPPFYRRTYFSFVTNHKPLIYSLSASSDKYTLRQIQQLDFISQFTSGIRHICGCDNSVADALSRLDVQAAHQWPSMIDFHSNGSRSTNWFRTSKLTILLYILNSLIFLLMEPSSP